MQLRALLFQDRVGKGELIQTNFTENKQRDYSKPYIFDFLFYKMNILIVLLFLSVSAANAGNRSAKLK